VIGIVVHLAYHFGEMRQINHNLKGPSAREADERSLDSKQIG